MSKEIAFEAAVPSPDGRWFDPLGAGVRRRARGFVEHMIEEELAASLAALRQAM